MKLGDPIKLPANVVNVLNLHIAGLALLVILNLFLIVRLGFALRDLGSGRQDELQRKQVQLAQLEVQNKRLEGLPAKVALSREDADEFYAQRIPANYSSILAGLGALALKDNVRLTRAGYNQAPAIEGLVELRIDASLAGDYSGVMHFINGLERDKTLYVINALTLTGQQEGTVNLRLRLTTYLHARDASQLPPSSEPENDQPSAPAKPADQSEVQPPQERQQAARLSTAPVSVGGPSGEAR